MGNTTKTPTKTTTPTKGVNTTPTPPPTPGGTFTPPVPVTPVNRKGNSTVKYPVGKCWVGCLQLTHGNKGVLLKRNVYTQHCIGLGVTYNTVRTQVQRYLQWVNQGSNPLGLPKGVTITK